MGIIRGAIFWSSLRPKRRKIYWESIFWMPPGPVEFQNLRQMGEFDKTSLACVRLNGILKLELQNAIQTYTSKRGLVKLTHLTQVLELHRPRRHPENTLPINFAPLWTQG